MHISLIFTIFVIDERDIAQQRITPESLAGQIKYLMKKLVNLENALVIAVINPNHHGRKVFAMFFVEKQQGNDLDVLPVWDMDNPDVNKGQINGYLNSVRKLKVEDIWSFVTELNKWQIMWLRSLDLDYRFHKDEDALERLASKLDMDLMHIGYEDEAEDGTWFTCLRIDNAIRNILPADLHVYSLRADDNDDSQPASIEDKVLVNHFGDILTDKSLPVPVQLEVDEILYDDEGNIMG